MQHARGGMAEAEANFCSRSGRRGQLVAEARGAAQTHSVHPMPAPRAAEVRAGGLSPQNPLRSSNVERHCTLKPDTIPELSAHCCQEKEIECAVVRMARTVKLAVIKKSTPAYARMLHHAGRGPHCAQRRNNHHPQRISACDFFACQNAQLLRVFSV